MSAESPPPERGNAADREDLQRDEVSKHLRSNCPLATGTEVA
jgi:hypothetical protein